LTGLSLVCSRICCPRERIRTAIQKAREGREAVLGQGAAASSGGSEASSRFLGSTRVDAPAAPGSSAGTWAALEVYRPQLERMDTSRIVTFDQKDDAHVAYDMMRTRLLASCRQNGWTVVGITSPTPGCGKTVTAINLAFSLARQKDTKTVLMDVDLRRPRVADDLGIVSNHSMGQFLSGGERVEDHFLVYGETLAIGTNKRRSLHSAEILQDAKAGEAMSHLRRVFKPDVVLVDLPPMMATDDVIAFLPNLDAVLVVVAAGQTQMREIDDCERELSERTNVMGVVLNKCEYTPEGYGYKYD